ncbi:MAG: ATP-binding protein [Oceanidesulfovibrio sp.]
MFRPAQRSSANLRLALCGPSGSGKTFSALRIAQGLGERIALIDTERGSGELYSDLCDYDVARLDPLYTPARYIEAIQAADKAGYDVLIIDSLSHAWAGQGGVLEMKDHAEKSTRNSFAAWREVTPEHNRLVDAILEAGLHVIATMRTKTAYEVQKKEDGKTRVVKVGLEPIQRDGLEYEFTTVFDLAIEGHVASATKDRTRLFDGQRVVLDEETGRRLRAWLGDTQEGISNPVRMQQGMGSGLQLLREQLDSALEDLGLEELRGAYEAYAVEKYGVSTLDELGQDELTEQLVILRQCQERPVKLEQFEELLLGKMAA